MYRVSYDTNNYGGECYFNVGRFFFFLVDERGECFSDLGVFFFFFLWPGYFF